LRFPRPPSGLLTDAFCLPRRHRTPSPPPSLHFFPLTPQPIPRFSPECPPPPPDPVHSALHGVYPLHNNPPAQNPAFFFKYGFTPPFQSLQNPGPPPNIEKHSGARKRVRPFHPKNPRSLLTVFNSPYLTPSTRNHFFPVLFWSLSNCFFSPALQVTPLFFPFCHTATPVLPQFHRLFGTLALC